MPLTSNLVPKEQKARLMRSIGSSWLHVKQWKYKGRVNDTFHFRAIASFQLNFSVFFILRIYFPLFFFFFTQSLPKNTHISLFIPNIYFNIIFNFSFFFFINSFNLLFPSLTSYKLSQLPLVVCAGRIWWVKINIFIQSATNGLGKFQSTTNPPNSKSDELVTDFGGFNSMS